MSVHSAFWYMKGSFSEMGSQDTLEQYKQDEERRHPQTLFLICAAQAVAIESTFIFRLMLFLVVAPSPSYGTHLMTF